MMMRISYIHVSTTGSLLQLIYIRRCGENIQNYMSANPDYKNISIYNYKQEILLTFILALHLYVTNAVTRLYVEVISKIQCYIFTKKTHFYKGINAKYYCQQIC